MDANELASRVAHHMLASEGTGPAWDLNIEEVREDYARVSMVVRADMLNGHGFAHGGMIFALADSAFAYVATGRTTPAWRPRHPSSFSTRCARARR